MIYEFALQPEILSDWANFQSHWEEFGPSKGRLIAEYPKTWRRMVQELIQNRAALNQIPPVRATAIAAKLSAEKHKYISARGRAFDPSRDWLENATNQQATALPFRAILAAENPTRHSGVLVPGEFDRAEQPWRVETHAKIARTKDAICKCAELLLCDSRELTLVDPNFDCTAPRFTRVLGALVAAGRWRKLQLHTACPQIFAASRQLANFERYVSLLVPSGLHLEVFFWKRRPGGEKMHGRFILTERGALQLDYGLDEGDSEGDTTYVNLVDQQVFSQLRADYSVGGAFDLATPGPMSVPGTLM